MNSRGRGKYFDSKKGTQIPQLANGELLVQLLDDCLNSELVQTRDDYHRSLLPRLASSHRRGVPNVPIYTPQQKQALRVAKRA